MSLINKTLQNLDKQKRLLGNNSGDEENVLAGLNAAAKHHSRRRPGLLWFVVLFIVVVVTLGYFAWPLKNPQQNKNAVIKKPDIVQPLKKAPARVSAKQPPVTAKKVSKPKPAKITKQAMYKVLVPLTPQQKAQQQYQQALQLLAVNQMPQAIKILRNILIGAPGYVSARTTLAVALFKTGQIKSADKVLVTGLLLEPDNIKLITLRAQFLASDGRIGDALITLQQHTPALAQHPDYYALLATLYQKQQQFMLAARMYAQLVALYPDQAAWWAGLGFALESAGQNNAAIEAYQRALRVNAQVDPQVRAYVAAKLNQLR